MDVPVEPVKRTVTPYFNSFKAKIPHIGGPRKWVFVVSGVLAAVAVFIGVSLFIKGRNTGEMVRPIPYNEELTGDIPERVISPITGEYYQGQEAKDWWIRRPLAVMVNNHTDARPQSGLVDADIVYEIVAEGGITRFLAFYLSETPVKIGPVRSTREYYLVLVKELGDAMIMHIGWSPQALEAIETWPVRSLGRGAASFWRENPRDVAIEHTAYVNGEDLYARGLELGWEGKAPLEMWKFKDTDKYLDAPFSRNITIDFWYAGDYSSIWKYDPDKGSYLRFMGYDADANPIPHEDQETGEQIEVKNLIVQFADETTIEGDDKNRLDYQLLGSGKGFVFLDGRVVEVTWSKAERDTRTRFYDINGAEMEFSRGKFWVSIVPSRNVEQVVFD
ncbi:MAG: DUF3048 domain-containing protein [Patescibacteria group bacterium]|jgi:hypothetical protein